MDITDVPAFPNALELLVVDISSVVSKAIDWVGTVASTVVGNPVLLIGVTIGFVGLGVGLFKRLLRV